MTEVLIDGIRYEPARDPGELRQPSVGIGVTTRNRWGVLEQTLRKIREHTPYAKVVLVDDASDEFPADFNYELIDGIHRFAENVGIARAKNKCLELLDAEGFEHIFLFDDDAFPVVDHWTLPYIVSPEPHLMRIFDDLAGPQKLNDIKRIYEDDEHVAYTGPRGVMLYVERRVLPIVGGMDVAFGKWGYEHGDWSNRIYNAGFTTWRFADVADSTELIYSHDEHEGVDRSVDQKERRALARTNVERYKAQWDSAEYREYRELGDVILTCLYTSEPDPQRPGTKNRLKIQALDPLLDSLHDHEVVVMLDDPAHFPERSNVSALVHTLGVKNLYVQRWVSYLEFLRRRPEVERVWMIDGTDVELYGDPWQIEPGKLYLGVEPSLVSSGWLANNRSAPMVDFIAEHGHRPILNAGLVGGHRDIVLEFLHDLTKLYFDTEIAVFLKRGQSITEHVNDMGMLNIVARSPKWRGRIEYGSQWNTVFKANEPRATATAVWRHK